MDWQWLIIPAMLFLAVLKIAWFRLMYRVEMLERDVKRLLDNWNDDDEVDRDHAIAECERLGIELKEEPK